MYNLFAFAIGVRVRAFIFCFVRLWRGNLPFAKLIRTKTNFLWKNLCDSLLAFSPLLVLNRICCILLWILNA